MSSKKNAKGPDTRNPSLKKYFKYMVNSRKLTIQFTQGKIREIILSDLKIDFNSFSQLLKDVSVEAFAYYIQGWPGWQPSNFQECIDQMEESYKSFKHYLRSKIAQLQEKEKEYVRLDEKTQQLSVVGHSIFPPEEAGSSRPASSQGAAYKVKYPYSLEVSGKPQLLSLLSFERALGEAVLRARLPGETAPETARALDSRSTLNHPFVSAQLKLPLLLKLTRRSAPRLEMFLCSLSDIWKFPQHERIVDIRNFPARTNIYTAKFLQVLFAKLVAVVGSYSEHVSLEKRDEIGAVCAEFLADIYEANLNFSTIQECTEVCYNVGDAVYYSDSGKQVNFRKVYYPQVLFCLVYCSVLQGDIRPDGTLRYFDFHRAGREPGAELTAEESDFVRNVNCALHLSCTACGRHFSRLRQLQEHLLDTHPSQESLACTRCGRRKPLYDLLARRWSHHCTLH